MPTAVSRFPGGVSPDKVTIYGPIGLTMGRSSGKITGKNKVVFVDSAATGRGDGSNWKNAITTVQAGLNLARYNYAAYAGGSPTYTDINYDDDRQCFVIVAPTLQPSAPSTFAFAMSGNGCEIANMCVPVATAVFGMYLPPCESGRIHDMVLLGNGAGTYGMYIDETGLKGTSIWDCIIDSFITCGIYAATAAGAYAIQGRMFHNQIGGTSVKGIDIDITTCYNYIIWQNLISGA